jgi:hypothetical protein
MFPSIMWFRKQFLPKMWPIQLTFLHFPLCRMFLSSWLFVTLLYFSHDHSNWLSPAAHVETLSVVLLYCVKCASSITVQSHVISCIMLHWPLFMSALCWHMATTAVVQNVEGKRILHSGKAENIWTSPHIGIKVMWQICPSLSSGCHPHVRMVTSIVYSFII